MSPQSFWRSGEKQKAYPYITSGGLIQQTFQQFRKSFPAKVEAETLKKLGIASSNESFVIGILKFLHLIGEDNAKTPEGTKLFTSHKDEDFQKVLTDAVQKALCRALRASRT